uniref:Transposon protein n=1 Tax=Arundo donax TaxID=35708 RepID=A0A0A9E2D0_ARUDO
MAHILQQAAIAGSEKRELQDSTYSIRSSNVCLLISFSTELLFGSEKSNTTQHRLNLLTNRFCFSEFGTSLNETKGSMPATTLDGKTADDMRLMAEAGRPGGMLPQLLVRCIPVPLLH